ncbi:MAG: hypothetical protein MUE98_05325, partial [Rhodobacteraceae bacterium]|nr:hypothetical protein [Paracoccaceae bacterium]
GAYAKGSQIRGLEELPQDSRHMVFHAGTAARDGGVIAAGGRVLNVTARGATLAEARERAYGMVDRIDWPGGFCRRDIGSPDPHRSIFDRMKDRKVRGRPAPARPRRGRRSGRGHG